MSGAKQLPVCFANLARPRPNKILVCLVSALLQMGCAPSMAQARVYHENSEGHPPLENAHRDLEEATRLRADGKESSLRLAVEKYRLALKVFKNAGRRRDETIAHMKLGEVFSLLDEQKNALEEFEQALNLSRIDGDKQQQVEVLNKKGEVHALLEENSKAIAIFQQALRLAKKIGMRTELARSTSNLGMAFYNVSDLRALDFLLQALKLWEGVEEPNGRVQTLRFLGYLYTDMSEYPLALQHLQQALTICRAVHDLQGEAQTVNVIALIHSLLGEKEQAIENYSLAEQIFRSIGDREGLITALNGQGEVYLDLNLNQALDCHGEALKLSQETGDLRGQAISHQYLGKNHLALGDLGHTAGREEQARGHYESSIKHYQEALSVSLSLKDQRIEAYILQDLGEVSDSVGDVKNAIGYYQRALLLGRIVKDRRGQALVLNRVGMVYVKTNQMQRALSYFHQALPLTRTAQDHGNESLTLYNIAYVQLQQGALSAASVNIDKAVEIIESLRARVPGQGFRSSYFASVHKYYELRIDLQMQQHKQNPDAGLHIKALQDSELARARGLMDMLTDSRSAFRVAAPELLDEERKLRQTLNGKAEYQMNLLDGEHSPEEAVAAEKQIRQLTTRYENVQDQIRRQNPHYAALTQPRPIDINEIQQQVLDNDSLLLEYSLGDNRSYLWVVGKTEIESYELAGRSEIEALVRRFYDLLTASQPVPGETFDQRRMRITQADAQLPSAAAALGSLILGPAAAKLENKRLLIVSDGALQYVPFQALIVPEVNERADASKASDRDWDEDGLRPLIFSHEIVNEPSASALALLLDETKGRQPPSRSVAVLADPVFETDDPRIESGGQSQAGAVSQSRSGELHPVLRDVVLPNGWSKIPRLLGSRAEADAIMAAVPWGTGMKAIDFEASRATATSPELNDYRIVHFATHGFLIDEHPELSGVVLSLVDQRGQRQDGFLRLHDIYNLSLPVDLVVLSACNTGLGKDVRGEGLVGLTRGFIYAGASGVIASLWKVDDEATADLMGRFYEAMFTEKLSPSAALRKAQLELSQQKRWRSPYYWAGFVIQGQYTQRDSSDGKTITLPVKLVGLATLMIILLCAGLYSIKHTRKKISK